MLSDTHEAYVMPFVSVLPPRLKSSEGRGGAGLISGAGQKMQPGMQPRRLDPREGKAEASGVFPVKYPG